MNNTKFPLHTRYRIVWIRKYPDFIEIIGHAIYCNGVEQCFYIDNKLTKL